MAYPGASYSAERVEARVTAVISADDYLGVLDEPMALFYDENKDWLYVADSANGRLVSFDKELLYLSELAHEHFALPTGIVKSAEGKFFIIDSAKGGVVLIDVKEQLVEDLILSGLPKADSRVYVSRIAIDNEGLLYLVDKLNKRILVVDQDGSFIRALEVRGADFYGFNDVRVDESGSVYAVDTIGKKVYIFDKKGKLVRSFGGRDTETPLNFPVSVDVNSKGLIYVLDRRGGEVVVFDKFGSFQYTVSSPGVSAGNLISPSYIFIDDSDRLFIADGSRIQVFE